jgi:hypothetical protein
MFSLQFTMTSFNSSSGTGKDTRRQFTRESHWLKSTEFHWLKSTEFHWLKSTELHWLKSTEFHWQKSRVFQLWIYSRSCFTWSLIFVCSMWSVLPCLSDPIYVVHLLIVVIWIMLSVSLYPKVITLSGLHSNFSSFVMTTKHWPLVRMHFRQWSFAVMFL